MSNKSYVAMEQHVCPVCGVVHDTGAILLDRRLRDSMDRHVTTGYSMCAKCEELKDDCFIALVEARPPKVKPGPDGVAMVQPDEVERLGRIFHIHESAWRRFTDVPVPEGYMAFVEPEVLDVLVAMYEREHGEPPGRSEDRLRPVREDDTPTTH